MIILFKYTLKIDGMMCSMCASHINDAVRRNFKVKKVTSSHSKGETEIITEDELDENLLRKVIGSTGYTLNGIEKEPYKKKGLFGF